MRGRQGVSGLYRPLLDRGKSVLGGCGHAGINRFAPRCSTNHLLHKRLARGAIRKPARAPSPDASGKIDDADDNELRMTSENRFEALLDDAGLSPAPQTSGIETVQVPVDALQPGRYQPRQHVFEESLAELADSIREQGILQPLVVRRLESDPTGAPSGRYEIVAGERRWQAAKMAGLTVVPVIVRNLDDQSALAVALIENLQREDLNPIDQAESLHRLAAEFRLTHEEVAKAVGRSRATVSNLLRLLDLEAEVKDLLIRRKLDMGHARALLPLDAQRQIELARKAERRGMSVRQVEKAARTLLTVPESGTDNDARRELETRWLQRQLEKEVGERVTIRRLKSGGYSLSLSFADLTQLERSLERLQDLVARVRETAGPRARDTG